MNDAQTIRDLITDSWRRQISHLIKLGRIKTAGPIAPARSSVASKYAAALHLVQQLNQLGLGAGRMAKVARARLQATATALLGRHVPVNDYGILEGITVDELEVLDGARSARTVAA